MFRLPELVYHLLVTAKFDVSLFRIVEILFFYLSTLHVFACLFIRLAEDRNDELASWYIRLPVIAKPASPSPDDPCCYGIGRPGQPPNQHTCWLDGWLDQSTNVSAWGPSLSVCQASRTPPR